MRVLIIGGTRFVGYQLVWRLLAGGHQITLLNRGQQPDPFGERVGRLIADRTTPDFERVLADLTYDAAVDFAAYTGDDARRSVAKLAHGRVGHYLYISTGQVYLVREGCPQPSKESDYDGPVMPEPADPQDLNDWRYGIGKRDGEDMLESVWELARFPATRLRLPIVNGERDFSRRLESYLWRVLDGGPVLLPDGGANILRHVYSGSVVTAIAAMLGQPATFGQAYNLAQDETPTLAELVALLADLLGAPTRTVSVKSAALAANGLTPKAISPLSGRWMSYLDPAKAKAELGFQHEPLRSYLGKIVSSFLNHPPTSPPDNYANRQAELALAANLP
ncbi:MAG TPA: NAD-dependent epimerase/dehydratase family protein [Ktedonobacterales bacterium]|jgi:nucleoside-diphosphate-sugar epimerase